MKAPDANAAVHWRTTALTLIEVGRELQKIEDGFRKIGATAVFNDEYAGNVLQDICSAARRLVKLLERLR